MKLIIGSAVSIKLDNKIVHVHICLLISEMNIFFLKPNLFQDTRVYASRDQFRELQSWTKPLRLFQLILQSNWTLTKQTLCPPPPKFNVVNNAETTFGNIPWHKLNIELGERGLKKGNMIQHGVYYQNMWILYRGKIVQPVMSKI